MVMRDVEEEEQHSSNTDEQDCTAEHEGKSCTAYLRYSPYL